MNCLFRICLILLAISGGFVPSFLSQVMAISPAVKGLTSADSLTTIQFDSEFDFILFIQQNKEQSSSQKSLSSMDSTQLDSLFLALNRDKKIVIPKAILHQFGSFTLEEPILRPIIAQRLDLFPKDKQTTISFEVNEGDHFFLTFDPVRSGGKGTAIEVLFNEVRVLEDSFFSKKSAFKFDFLSSRSGKVDVIFRNFGFFRMQGELQIDIKPRKERITLQYVNQRQAIVSEIPVLVQDTLFKTLFDEKIVLSHKLNLKNALGFSKQFEDLSDPKILGFAVFLYPFSRKGLHEIQRREIYREDPLQDFALKELLGKSYTYLPEYDLPGIDFSVGDGFQKKYWVNGVLESGGSWGSSPNSKRNYAFFNANESVRSPEVWIRVSNHSSLYDHEIGLQIIALFLESFTVKQEKEESIYEELIVLTLL